MDPPSATRPIHGSILLILAVHHRTVTVQSSAKYWFIGGKSIPSSEAQATLDNESPIRIPVGPTVYGEQAKYVAALAMTS
jgi:hypothetical protein